MQTKHLILAFALFFLIIGVAWLIAKNYAPDIWEGAVAPEYIEKVTSGSEKFQSAFAYGFNLQNGLCLYTRDKKEWFLGAGKLGSDNILNTVKISEGPFLIKKDETAQEKIVVFAIGNEYIKTFTFGPTFYADTIRLQ